MAITHESNELKRVTLSSIKEELRALWAAEAMTDEAVIRARTHNLIVYTADDVAVEETTRRVIEITSERPGRVVVIDVHADLSKTTDAWVTTYCRKVGSRQICGELITLSIASELQREIQSTVMGLLAPDLPVFLLWAGVPKPGHQLFDSLAPAADRVIIDTGITENTPELLASAQNATKHRIGDLSWARITLWRQLVAQAWDFSDLRKEISNVDGITIRFNSKDVFEHSSQPFLLAGWLVDRLGWTLLRVTKGHHTSLKIECKFGTTNTLMKLEIVPTTSLTSGEIVGIDFSASEKSLSLTLRDDHKAVETNVADKTLSLAHCMNSYRSPDSSAALAEEIEFGFDPSYEAALTKSVEIMRLSKT